MPQRELNYPVLVLVFRKLHLGKHFDLIENHIDFPLVDIGLLGESEGFDDEVGVHHIGGIRPGCVFETSGLMDVHLDKKGFFLSPHKRL